MSKIDNLFDIFDDEMIPVPSGLILHCTEPSETKEILDKFRNHYGECYEEFISGLLESVGADFEYGVLPDKNIDYEITGTDIKIIFSRNGYNLFSIDYGRNLPSPDEYDEFDGVINKTIQELKRTFPDLKFEGLFAWNYNNGMDYVNYHVEVCNCDTNKYAIELLTNALKE